MPATYTLASTTITREAQRDDPVIGLASTAGLAAGIRLFADEEMMSVVSLVPDGVRVLRGVDGTRAGHHDVGSTVWIGSGDKFYFHDPVGDPQEVVLVSPHINVTTGAVWFAKGDTGVPGADSRWWQRQAVSYSIGPLGIRTVTYDPTTSD